jgi:hypothetical protein
LSDLNKLESSVASTSKLFSSPNFLIAAIPTGMLACRNPLVLENIRTFVFAGRVALIKKAQRTATQTKALILRKVDIFIVDFSVKSKEDLISDNPITNS